VTGIGTSSSFISIGSPFGSEAVRPRLLVVSLDAGRRRNSSLRVWTYGLSWL
jgi:hypothetical protein